MQVIFTKIILPFIHYDAGPERCTVNAGPAEDARSNSEQEKARREQQHQHSVKVGIVAQTCIAEINYMCDR